jgi:glutamate-1-semialdehyde 2,1-aminomutase
MNTTISDALFGEAVALMPGGVNSPVRAFRSVQRSPVFIAGADGAYMTDVDGNQYIDYVCSWGPIILGHNHTVIKEAVFEAVHHGLSFGAATPGEVDMASLMTQMVPGLEMVRMVNSGTEATMSALRAARGFTKRPKIIKFAGCYHGHSDGLLVQGGSGQLSEPTPTSAGVSPNAIADTLIARYNNPDSVASLLQRYKGEVAAVIIEPVAANMGVVLPKDGFLSALRELCDGAGALLVFDEVITGFRLAAGGASERFGVRPDLWCFGKIIGGGMPVGAYGGRRDVMSLVSPVGPVYQAGTLSGNPIAMAAGIAQLQYLKTHPDIYTQLEANGNTLFDGLERIAGSKCTVNHIGSIGTLFFTPGPVDDLDGAMQSDTSQYARYFTAMLENGIYLAPAQFEAMFLNAAHTDADITRALKAAATFFADNR